MVNNSNDVQKLRWFAPVINTIRNTTWMQICGMFFEIRIKATFGPSFHASETSVYKEFQGFTTSD